MKQKIQVWIGPHYLILHCSAVKLLRNLNLTGEIAQLALVCIFSCLAVPCSVLPYPAYSCSSLPYPTMTDRNTWLPYLPTTSTNALLTHPLIQPFTTQSTTRTAQLFANTTYLYPCIHPIHSSTRSSTNNYINATLPTNLFILLQFILQM